MSNLGKIVTPFAKLEFHRKCTLSVWVNIGLRYCPWCHKKIILIMGHLLLGTWDCTKWRDLLCWWAKAGTFLINGANPFIELDTPESAPGAPPPHTKIMHIIMLISCRYLLFLCVCKNGQIMPICIKYAYIILPPPPTARTLFSWLVCLF